jgi:hypothetical protein
MERKSLSGTSRRFSTIACAALVAASVSSQAMALSLPVNGKKGSLQLPINTSLEELTPEAVPTTDTKSDTKSDTATGTTGGAAPSAAAPAKPITLAPLKLGEEEPVDIPENGGKVFQLKETKTDLAPQTKGAGGLPTQSMKPGKGEGKAKKLTRSMQEAAAKVSVQPLALTNDTDELQKNSEFLEKNETKQIAALWEATLNRSPDIHFVIQRMVPTSNAGHAATVLTRMVGNVLYAGIGSMGMVSPNQGTYAAQNFASNALGQLMGTLDAKDKKHAQLGEAELISLYNMVRQTADKLVDKYRDYKKSLVNLNRATTDFQDLNNMMKEARVGQDAAKQLEMEYTVRKAQRDMINISDDIHRYRQSLTDMAGNDAVDKLDQDVQTELQNLGEGNSSLIADKTKTPPM